MNSKPRPLYPRERDVVAVVQEVGWALGPVWTGAEILASYRDSMPGTPSPKKKVTESKRSELKCM
jgi:hypothetical protein